MRYIKWGFILAVVLGVVAFFHYSLPQHDVVRIVDTEVARMDLAGDKPGESTTRDVRLIYAKYADGGEMEYRNEDTGWGFPWFFKFDSDNLQNRAADFKSTQDSPRWVVIQHYGWRMPMFSMYPNAISIRAASGPTEDGFPWFNVVFLGLLTIVLLFLIRIVIILRRRHIDPVVARIDQGLDDGAGWWRRQWRKISGK